MRCALRDGMSGRDGVAIAASSPLAIRFYRSNAGSGLVRCAARPTDHRLSPIGRAAIDWRRGAMCWSCQARGMHRAASWGGPPVRCSVRSYARTRQADSDLRLLGSSSHGHGAMPGFPATDVDTPDSILQARNDTGGRSRLCARSPQRQLSAAMPPTCPTRHPCRQGRGARPACSRCRSRHPHRYPANAWRAGPAHDPEWSAACRRAGRSRRST